MADAEVKEVKEEAPDQVADVAEIQKQLEHYKSEAKKAFDTRDKIKKELELIRLKEQEEKGQYQELYTQTKTELEEKRKALEEYQTKYTGLVESQKEELLNSLPDGDAKEFAKGLEDITKLRNFVAIQKKSKPEVDTSTSLTKAGKVSAKNFKEWQEQYNN